MARWRCVVLAISCALVGSCLSAPSSHQPAPVVLLPEFDSVNGGINSGAQVSHWPGFGGTNLYVYHQRRRALKRQTDRQGDERVGYLVSHLLSHRTGSTRSCCPEWWIWTIESVVCLIRNSSDTRVYRETCFSLAVVYWPNFLRSVQRELNP